MIPAVATLLALLLMTGALVLVPLGLPGVWIMVAVLLVAAVAGALSWTLWAILAGLTLLSEVVEFLLLKAAGERYGGSRGAFWGAVAGGLAGVVVGVPVPVVGPIVAALVGTFLGAFGVSVLQERPFEEASRVGWGMVLARTAAAAVKTGVGVVVLVAGGGALLLS